MKATLKKEAALSLTETEHYMSRGSQHLWKCLYSSSIIWLKILKQNSNWPQVCRMK